VQEIVHPDIINMRSPIVSKPPAAGHKLTDKGLILHPCATVIYRRTRPLGIEFGNIQLVVEFCRGDGRKRNKIGLFKDIFSNGRSEKALTYI